MKKLLTLIVLLSVTFTVDAQRPRGKTTQRSKPRTTQRSPQRSASNSRQSTSNRLYSCPDSKHPHLIDLGLPSGTKWACCNVGADKPEAYGGYYAWGEAEEKESYTEGNYHGGTFLDVALVNSKQRRDAQLREENTWKYEAWKAKQEGKPEPVRKTNDIVQVSWKMPTYDQIKELVDNCKFQWTTINGVNGGKFTGPNGRSIFLPAAGYRYDCALDAGSYGGYWSSTRDPSRSNYAYGLGFYSGGAAWSTCYRIYGRTVRPVSR